MAREQASVAPPPRTTGEVFAPHPILRSSAPDGAALSLRLFSGTPDDATELVLGEASQLRLEPIPARAAPLFEAHATYQSVESDDSLTLGFPLVTYVQQGSSRAAPLFSLGGGRAIWTAGDEAWRLPRGARDGVPMALPTALVLEIDDDATYGLHGGVWHYLFGLGGEALASIARASRFGLGALVRAATRALELGGDGETASAEELDAEGDTSPVSQADLEALTLAASRRAPPSRGLRAFPHGMAMLPPRGDPTSSLRTDLRALLDDVAPARGPLAVYLGAPAAPPHDSPVWSCGSITPTSSQLAAARAFEGTSDLVAVCGPPGCGKTALLHVVAAQTVVACALSGQWDKPPRRSATWPLVVTSTNNAAVDHALAPFVGSPEIPLALRLGNRRSLAEVTATALAAAAAALAAPGGMSLDRARAAFEEHARPLRAAERERVAAQASERERTSRRGELSRRAAELRGLVARAEAWATPPAELDVSQVEAARAALSEHAEAADTLVRLHLEGARASVERACEKWARANELRTPRFAPVLGALGIPLPCGPLDAARARESAEAQGAALRSASARLDELAEWLALPAARGELLEIEAELQRVHTSRPDAPAPDAALYEAALLVRDAWAREHRHELSKRLTTALGAVGEGRAGGRAKPLPQALLELAPLFPIAGCTLLSMRTSFPLDKEVVDRLVVDEAAQCAPVYAVPALARARRAMFTGDVAQLPPVYTLDPRVDERLAKGLDAEKIQGFRMGAEAVTSAQAVAEPRARARVTLVEHFRSQRPIVELASRWSGYHLDVRTASRSLSDVSSRLVAPVVVLGVPGRGERAPEGVVNEAEVVASVGLVEALLRDGILPSDVAVLTPFVGQCVRIERELYARGLVRRGGVLVSTVHRLQGGERRVVVFSVAATARRHLLWLSERPHLLHVATSRARDHLIVLVDPDAVRSEPALAPFAEHVSRGDRAGRASFGVEAEVRGARGG